MVHRSERRVARRIGLVAVAAVTLLTSLGIVRAPVADALTAYPSGSPGTAQLVQSVMGSSNGVRYITGGQGTVYRSSAYSTSNQYICSQTRFWELRNNAGGTSTWYQIGTGPLYCGWAKPTQTGVTVPASYLWDPTYSIGYSVDVVTTWRLSTTAAPYGKRVYDYDRTADYACWVTDCKVGFNTNGAGAYIANYSIF